MFCDDYHMVAIASPLKAVCGTQLIPAPLSTMATMIPASSNCPMKPEMTAAIIGMMPSGFTNSNNSSVSAE